MQTWKGVWILVAAFAFATVVQSVRLAQSQLRTATIALRADSLEAVADTTRLLKVKTLGDSILVWQRRAVQEQQRADDLDKALGLERIARAKITLTLDSMRVHGTTIVTEVDSIRFGTWDLESIPFRVHAEAALPPAPGEGRLSMTLAVDPITLGARLSCGKANRVGIRPAQVTLFTPRWLTATIDSISQSSELCRSPALQEKGPRRLPWLIGGLVAGVVLWEVVR